MGAQAAGVDSDGTATAPPHTVVPAPVLPREQPAAVAELDGVLDAPIEDCMAFLGPAQAKLVRRSFNGPARIRGALTGKTVVGLHRAA